MEEPKISEWAREKMELMKALASIGIKNVLELKLDNIKAILSDENIELLEYLKDNEGESIREIARGLGRDYDDVKLDLNHLSGFFPIDIKEKDEEKVPVLNEGLIIIRI